LIRWYVADRGMGALERRDEGIVRHLAACPSCAARYARVCEDLDGAAVAAVEAADAAFTPDRLVQQRERILRRIESQSARVLAFPAHEARGAGPSASPAMWRWVVAAAAAGLFVGLAAGQLWQIGAGGTEGPQGAPTYAVGSIGLADAGLVLSTSAGMSDDRLLSEVDLALSAPGTPELEAIDAMTLRVRTVSAQGR